MKKGEVMSKMTGAIQKAGFKLQKHSPEILLVAGIVGGVASAVMACKATLKVEEIVDETQEKMDKIHESINNGATVYGIDYTAEDAKKDTAIVYLQTGLKFVKLYGPALTLGALSVTSILASNKILKERNVAITAALTAVDKSFKEYRSRVVERFGQEVDKELRYNLKAETVTEKVVDEETGEKKKVKKTNYILNSPKVSGYARLFEKYTEDEDGNQILNTCWSPTTDYNLMFIRSQESYCNDLLKAKKRLFLNDVYKLLGFPETKAGQVVGWVYDLDNPVGDNYVDFGLYSSNLRYMDSENGQDSAILLDFNVDGNIWELMK